MRIGALLLLNAMVLGAQTLPPMLPPIFPAGRFYAPYIMTRAATNLAQISADSGIRYFTLAFVLDGGGCAASWGSRTPVADEAALLPEIQKLRQQGGDVLVSFGGEAGKELAIGCDNAAALQAQYQAVIDKYKISVLDLDIEGKSLNDTASVDRRNVALAAIQTANPNIQISYTLPVATDGMNRGGIALLNNAMSHGVKVAVVNLMTMDYGGSADPLAMGAYAITAVNGATAQMLDNGIRARIGIIPMIGLNDVKPEVFTLSDARAMMDWAQSNPVVSRVSMWSVERDLGCADGTVKASSSCSGVAQQRFDFSKIMNTFH
jgi:hypothetical protein